MMNGRQYIDVPISEKEVAKVLGARWDRLKRSWFVPSGIDMTLFARWVRKGDGDSHDSSVAPEREHLAAPHADNRETRTTEPFRERRSLSRRIGPQEAREKFKRRRGGNGVGPVDWTLSARDELMEVMQSMGFLIEGDHPIMDGRWHRVKVEGDKRGAMSGSYVIYLDGRPAGYIKNFRTGEERRWKVRGHVMSPGDRARLQAEASARAAERELAKRNAQQAAAQRVRNQVARLMPIRKPTPYLLAKGIGVHDGILTDHEGKDTYIPAFDADGNQWTMQYIAQDGAKRFAKGARKTGCFHPVGGMKALEQAPVIVVAEGYATAATLSEALGQTVVVAFDSGNLLSVARALHQKYPDRPVVIAGDDDRHLELTQGINPGRVKAEAAAAAVGGQAWFPVFAPDEQGYPEDLRPITPDLFWEHERARHQLDAASGSDALAEQELNRLHQALLTPDQLRALDTMKRHTDFNDLAMRSRLGKDEVKRQFREFASQVWGRLTVAADESPEPCLP
jgi:DNA primase traC